MKQPINILTKELDVLSQTTDYKSLIFTRSWHGVGDFELVMHRDAVGADQIKKNCLVALDKNKVGIVRHREIQLDQNGKITENWLFKGTTLKGLIAKRKTVPPPHTAYDRRSGPAETVMKHYITNNFIEPYAIDGEDAEKRIMPNLVISPDQERGPHLSWQSRLKNVAEEEEEMSKATGIGWDVYLDSDNKQIIFDVFEGNDLTVNNSAGNSPVYFAPEFGNVKGQSYVDSGLNMKNIGYVGGQGEGVDRLFVVVGDATGWERDETFIDARDLGGEDEDEQELTEEEERELLETRGQQRMAELVNEEYFEAEIMTPVIKTTYNEEFKGFFNEMQPIYSREKETKVISPFVYGEDWNLGDICTVMNKKWGFIVDQRITELTEIHEPSGFSLEGVFGQKRPTLISKIKSEFKQHENELTR
ncbi:siphovirus ReqiPepy6 Gp37-like family protein [Salipaludibacillus aurantiacus]|uniref:Virus ReqiPepy6 Gp37-like protein n=1 Tax=Salipaludibacillus aurantiacus TaxID=1601833 RepID=A0A1H9TZW2_9BACI|nr:siphovirus ReqiPepy6 Gp37-like family protein [Salipaludibacillus aurantiacus]SES02538.1 virus ReqiPepy6 Gp37-like protein [Salipaludibacillus aurantiacus]